MHKRKKLTCSKFHATCFMKILFFNYEYPPLGGGAGNATSYILQEFSKIPDLEVDLITSAHNNEFSIEKISPSITIHKLPIGDKSQNIHYQSQTDLLLYTWKAFWYSQKLLKEKKYNLTHSFFSVPCGFISLLIKWQKKIPYIVSLRGADVPGYSNRFPIIYFFLTPLIKLIWSQASAVISNSQGLKELALKSKPKQKISVIFNGIDTQEFKPTNQKDYNIFEILCVSRLTQRKGIAYLISAFAKIYVKFPNTKLNIVGEGDVKKKLITQAKNLNLTKNIEFTGRIAHEKLPQVYSQSSIFVLPSLNEGMSNTILEAMSAGLPIIATNTGGTKELVIEGENGFVVKMEDADDIYQKIKTLIENTDLVKKMSQKSREMAEHLSWKNVANQYLEEYQKSQKVNE